jgi:pectate lyase
MIPRTGALKRFCMLPALLIAVGCSSDTNTPTGDEAGGASAGGSAPSVAGSTASGGSNSAGTSASGGTLGSSGSASQGGMNAAGRAGAGGTSSGGGSSGGTSSGGTSSGGTSSGGGSSGAGGAANPNEIAMTIPMPSNGQGEIRNGTTTLKNAANGGKDVWDFTNQKIGVNNQADCDSGEGQTTVFEVEDGVTVRNLIIAGGLPGGNGIVCKGNCTLEYVYWEDVCEDAATNAKDGATMTLNHVIALHATDKVFQHNAKGNSKTIIKNSYVSDFGKLWRSCGDCEDNGGPRNLIIDNVRVDGVKTAVAGANQNYKDTVTITNLFVKGGYKSGSDSPKICTEYLAVTDHMGESTSVANGKSQWSTATCKVTQADVKSY